MPIYEYKCGACGHRLEKLQKLSDPPCKKCPQCGGSLTKLISSPAIQFKGNGFYITDYAKKHSPSEERKAKADVEAKPEAKSEAKSEKNAETGSAAASTNPDRSAKPAEKGEFAAKTSESKPETKTPAKKTSD
ncbi:MAG: zinc ribbon domain-containing protein [Candidatus Aminicenantes bacterium]|nr:zinc ribbon domain-containing protein [Candidatus Aminicenantes bacterium]